MSIEARRAQLVEAAIVVMTREGVRAATTRAVVAEADTSLSVFHYCFDSKHALLQAVVTELVARSASRSSAAGAAGAGLDGSGLDGSGSDDAGAPASALHPRVLVRASLEAYFEHVLAHPAIHQLTYEVTQFCLRDPELVAIAAHQYDLYASTVEAQIVASGARTSLPVTVFARQLAVMIDGLTLDWLVRRDEASSRTVLETTITFAESVILAEQ